MVVAYAGQGSGGRPEGLCGGWRRRPCHRCDFRCPHLRRLLCSTGAAGRYTCCRRIDDHGDFDGGPGRVRGRSDGRCAKCHRRYAGPPPDRVRRVVCHRLLHRRWFGGERKVSPATARFDCGKSAVASFRCHSVQHNVCGMGPVSGSARHRGRAGGGGCGVPHDHRDRCRIRS